MFLLNEFREPGFLNYVAFSAARNCTDGLAQARKVRHLNTVVMSRREQLPVTSEHARIAGYMFG